jgi:hypothetical protein
LDFNLGLKIAGLYAHLGYLGYIFDPQKIFFIYFSIYAILGLFRPFVRHFMPFYAISTVVTKVAT